MCFTKYIYLPNKKKLLLFQKNGGNKDRQTDRHLTLNRAQDNCLPPQVFGNREKYVS